MVMSTFLGIFSPQECPKFIDAQACLVEDGIYVGKKLAQTYGLERVAGQLGIKTHFPETPDSQGFRGGRMGQI